MNYCTLKLLILIASQAKNWRMISSQLIIRRTEHVQPAGPCCGCGRGNFEDSLNDGLQVLNTWRADAPTSVMCHRQAASAQHPSLLFFGGGSAHHLILRSAQFASGEFIGSRASHLRIHPVFTRCAAGTSAPCRPAGVAVRVVQLVQRSQQWRLTLRIGGFLQLICRLKNSGFRVDGTDSKMSFSWGSI